MVRVKITRNYQVTIPAEIRIKMGLREGDYLEVYLDRDNRIIMEKIAPRKRKTLKLGRRLTPEEIEELIEKGIKESIK